ncbi:16S rRNA (uracil(1498)-N(3))-methyltransferase [Canibacter oris]|uniref:Ribosomal RNA small subunit methyltransferase E n=1 Tax=Canibacter oris TaxID=1365628 RepID=A0A840DP68_9MICO|nr:16S rRNA (uracil(1498)-N(3))-methyltransferase [Canibacter oris]MBB4071339.1 16S rRNA (uracil1498-N3)-methyltransferase [Canibacter oris]
MAHLYYHEQLPQGVAVGDTVVVAGAEAHHAVNVSRLKSGEQVLLSDGRGLRAAVEIAAVCAGKTPEFSAVVRDLEVLPQELPQLVLVQALAKGGRDERAVELCTELGVDVIVPWQAARSVAVWQGAVKQEKGVQKWAKIAREAAKQALRPRYPEVTAPCTLRQLESWAGESDTLLLVLHPWQQQRCTEIVREAVAAETALKRIVVVVGPEGGLTAAEVASLAAAGARVGLLGAEVLRTSSAGAAALAVVNTVLGRW